MPSSSPNPSGSITPDSLTPEREAEIGGRAAAATPGPWTVDLEQCDCSDGLCSHGTYVAAIYVDGERRSEFDEIPDADWQFIAHAREDVPALFAEIDRLRRAYVFDTAELKLEIDRLRGEAKRARALKPNVERALIMAAVRETLVGNSEPVDLATKVTDSVVAIFNEARGESR